jgi:hypothetical protein
MLVILLAASWMLLRHAVFALLAVLAPLPPSVFAASAFPVTYLCGFVVAAILIAGIEAQRSQGTAPALRQAWHELGSSVIWPPVVAAGMAAAFPLVTGHARGLSESVLILASAACAIVLSFPVARLLPFGEQAIIRINRLREARDRWLDVLAFVVQPRWGWSIAGIAMIFATMGYFGGANAGGAWLVAPQWIVPAWIAAGLVLGYAASRDMRRTFAFVLTGFVLVCLSYWAAARLHPSARDWNDAIALSMVPVTITLASAASFARAGDSVAVAGLRAMEQNAIVLIFALLAAWLGSALLAKWMLVCLLPFSAVAAVIVFPALTTAIYDLLPPRVSLDAYKLR